MEIDQRKGARIDEILAVGVLRVYLGLLANGLGIEHREIEPDEIRIRIVTTFGSPWMAVSRLVPAS